MDGATYHALKRIIARLQVPDELGDTDIEQVSAWLGEGAGEAHR